MKCFKKIVITLAFIVTVSRAQSFTLIELSFFSADCGHPALLIPDSLYSNLDSVRIVVSITATDWNDETTLYYDTVRLDNTDYFEYLGEVNFSSGSSGIRHGFRFTYTDYTPISGTMTLIDLQTLYEGESVLWSYSLHKNCMTCPACISRLSMYFTYTYLPWRIFNGDYPFSGYGGNYDSLSSEHKEVIATVLNWITNRSATVTDYLNMLNPDNIGHADVPEAFCNGSSTGFNSCLYQNRLLGIAQYVNEQFMDMGPNDENAFYALQDDANNFSFTQCLLSSNYLFHLQSTDSDTGFIFIAVPFGQAGLPAVITKVVFDNGTAYSAIAYSYSFSSTDGINYMGDGEFEFVNGFKQAVDETNFLAFPRLTITADGATTFCRGNSVTLTAQYGSGDYFWSPAGANASSIIVTDAGAYTLQIQDEDGCYADAADTIVVTVHENPVADAGSDARLCYSYEIVAGDSPVVTGGTSPYYYLWKNNDGDTVSIEPNPTIIADTTRDFYILVTDSLGCSDRDTFHFAVNPPIVVNAGPDTILFMNQSVQLYSTVTAGGTSPFTYVWSPPLWLSDSTVSNPVCTPISSQQYELMVTDSFGCMGDAFATVDFQLFDMGDLSTYAVFASDSLFLNSPDSTVALGNAGAKYIDTTHFKLHGQMNTESDSIDFLHNNLAALIAHIDTLPADTLGGDLSGVTLSPGIYRIDTTAYLNGVLTLAGNDSSYFIFDMDSDLIVTDTSRIIHDEVAPEKVFFSVNGKILMGDSLTLNCIFLCRKNIDIGGFNGIAQMQSMESVKINASARRLEAIDGADEHPCSYSPVFTDVIFPRFNTTDYVQVFNDEFNTLQVDNNSLTKRWRGWGGYGKVSSGIPGDKDNFDPKYNWFINHLGQGNDYLRRGDKLVLRLNKLKPPKFSPYIYTDPKTGITNTYHFSSGQIVTNANFYHGYFEIKAKFPHYKNGMWFAFWLINGRCEYPEHSYREIDWIDHGIREKTKVTYGYFPDNCNEVSDGGYYCPLLADRELERDVPIDASLGYHIYGGEWTEDYINFYFDNQLVVHFEPNEMNDYLVDMRMRLALDQYIDVWTADPTYTGVRGRDFMIDYVKVYQKKSEVASNYFVDDYTQQKITDPTFTATTCTPSPAYHIETSYIPGAKYTWTPSSSDIIIDAHTYNYSGYGTYDNGIDLSVTPQAADSKKFGLCYFHGTVPGSYYIDLTVELPYPNHYIKTERIYFNIIAPVPAPTVVYSGCFDHLFGIENDDAIEYRWSCDGGLTYDNPTTSAVKYCTISSPYYDVKVKAIYDCYESEAGGISGEYDFCGERISEDDSTDESKDKINSVKVYPSPSDGHLIIENNSTEKIVVILKLVNGVTIFNYLANEGEHKEINDLPQGMIIMEARREINYSIIQRKLIPIIHP